MLTPTKQQLEELGFTKETPIQFSYVEIDGQELYYNSDKNTFGGIARFYPQSIDDLKTLIRLLSPNN